MAKNGLYPDNSKLDSEYSDVMTAWEWQQSNGKPYYHNIKTHRSRLEFMTHVRLAWPLDECHLELWLTSISKDGYWKFIFKCMECGAWVLANKRNKKYCSDRCVKRNFRGYVGIIKKPCIVCGDEIEGNVRKLYCGSACNSRAQRVKKMRNRLMEITK
jgi:hypothetical protein